MSPTAKGERSIQDFARDLAKKLENHLATGLEAKDIEWIIVEAMTEEMRKR